jgi:hypothetical protein
METGALTMQSAHDKIPANLWPLTVGPVRDRTEIALRSYWNEDDAS